MPLDRGRLVRSEARCRGRRVLRSMPAIQSHRGARTGRPASGRTARQVFRRYAPSRSATPRPRSSRRPENSQPVPSQHPEQHCEAHLSALHADRGVKGARAPCRRGRPPCLPQNDHAPPREGAHGGAPLQADAACVQRSAVRTELAAARSSRVGVQTLRRSSLATFDFRLSTLLRFNVSRVTRNAAIQRPRTRPAAPRRSWGRSRRGTRPARRSTGCPDRESPGSPPAPRIRPRGSHPARAPRAGIP